MDPPIPAPADATPRGRRWKSGKLTYPAAVVEAVAAVRGERRRAAPHRRRTPSLRNADARWSSTVRGLTNRLAAISLFVRSAAARTATSRSRRAEDAGVRVASPRDRRLAAGPQAGPRAPAPRLRPQPLEGRHRRGAAARAPRRGAGPGAAARRGRGRCGPPRRRSPGRRRRRGSARRPPPSRPRAPGPGSARARHRPRTRPPGARRPPSRRRAGSTSPQRRWASARSNGLRSGSA